ncbi:50S ribosomal protein L14e [Candidatus Woesearchaeota archaeon]|nr:50S ribosomal protein L14e [Candidatus Woesearchaeota archaeon]
MIEVGRLCVKIAGRDAGGKCVIVDVLDDKFVMIDGNVRRRKCNVVHLEPLSEVIKISKGASHDSVKAEFEKLKIPVWGTKPKKAAERPKKVRGKKKKAEEAATEAKGKKKVTKKAAPKKAKEKKEEKPAKKPEETESVEELLGGEGEVKAEKKE